MKQLYFNTDVSNMTYASKRGKKISYFYIVTLYGNHQVGFTTSKTTFYGESAEDEWSSAVSGREAALWFGSRVLLYC